MWFFIEICLHWSQFKRAFELPFLLILKLSAWFCSELCVHMFLHILLECIYFFLLSYIPFSSSFFSGCQDVRFSIPWFKLFNRLHSFKCLCCSTNLSIFPAYSYNFLSFFCFFCLTDLHRTLNEFNAFFHLFATHLQMIFAWKHFDAERLVKYHWHATILTNTTTIIVPFHLYYYHLAACFRLKIFIATIVSSFFAQFSFQNFLAILKLKTHKSSSPVRHTQSAQAIHSADDTFFFIKSQV